MGLQLKKNKPLIIGITGSAGKSSCVKLVSLALAQKYKIKYTKKGNSETGIPLEILNIPVKNFSFWQWLLIIPKALKTLFLNWQKYQILVIEMGIDSNLPPKNMDTLLKIVHPKIGVLLNANHVHLENFSGEKTIQSVADEKAKLLFALPEAGLAILNSDQIEFQNFNKKIKAKIKTFSLKNKADIYLISHQVSLAGSNFKFNFKNQTFELNFKNQLIFKEIFGSLATAILIGDFLNIKTEATIKTLTNKFEVLPGRGRIFKGINQTLLIDSSYNSSLEPTVASLKMLRQIAENKNRTIAVLGDMRELGEKSKQDHQILEKNALDNADLILSVGPLTKQYFKNPKVLKFDNAYQALEKIRDIIKPNDLILVKGSQNTIFLEIIIEGLLENKTESQLLCRRGKYWNKQRNLIKK